MRVGDEAKGTGLKRCTRCSVEKELSEFRQFKRYYCTSYKSHCRPCEAKDSLERWRKTTAAGPEAEPFRRPELDWSPHSYNAPKELTSWLSRNRSTTQIAA